MSVFLIANLFGHLQILTWDSEVCKRESEIYAKQEPQKIQEKKYNIGK